VNTEITDYKAGSPSGWIFFDAECRFCVAGRRRWGKLFERRGYVWLPLQTPGTALQLGVTEEQLMAEMWVLPAGGRPVNGVAAWIELMRHVWWLWPVSVIVGFPVTRWLTRLCYQWIASHRRCFAGAVEMSKRGSEHHRHRAFLELP